MIYIITNSYPEKKEMFSTAEFEYILSKYNNFKVLSFSSHKDKRNGVSNIYIFDGIKEFIMPKKIKNRKIHLKMINSISSKDIGQFIKNIYSYLMALAIIRKNDIGKEDLLFSYWLTRSSVIAFYINKLISVNYICQGHGSDIYVYPPNIIKEILSKATNILTVGEQNKKYICEKYSLNEDKVKVFRLGVNCKIASQLTILNKKKHEKKIFLTIGRYTEVKGIDILLEVIKKLNENKKLNSNIEFRIFGDGPDYKNYQEFIYKNKLHENIKLGGWIDRENICNEFKVSWCYISPSRSEGLPVVLTEACAAHLPIIATNVGSCNEVAIDKYNAILVEKENVNELYKAILYMINIKDDSWKMMCENSYAIYEKRFKLEKNLDEKYEYISGLCKRSHE